MGSSMPMPNGSLEASLQECQLDLKAQCQEYSTAIQELRESLATVQREIQELKGQPAKEGFEEGTEAAGKDPPQRKSRRLVTKDFDSNDGISSYEFTPSMWDASLLCFFREVDWCDKSILIFGLLCNHVLQGLMLAVVHFDMLDNPFPPGKVGEMIEWRVSSGHEDAGFDLNTGKTKLTRLCKNELWSFEQSEYEEMHLYLYSKIPGYWLSLLAVILWILTTISEYRRTVEQGLAILTLPTVKSGDACLISKDGKIELVGIYRGTRIAVFLLLTLPRFLVVALISLVGCQYLAQTSSLHDIVLNAVALAFVLDVDEQLFNVFSSQRIRSMVDGMASLPCGKVPDKRLRAITLKDLIRYILVLGLVLVAYFVYLLPFHRNVEGAAAALCAGSYDFTFRGGSPTNATVVLYDSTDFVASCEKGDTGEVYFKKFYGQYNYSIPAFPAAPAQDFAYLRRKNVLGYAFSRDCGPGKVLMPIMLESLDSDSPPARTCKEVPTMLLEQLAENDVSPGVDTGLQRCNQFRPDLGEGTCGFRTINSGGAEACLWSWLSLACESSPPGDFNTAGCFNTTLPSALEVSQSCRVWSAFQSPNPFFNCDVITSCPLSIYPNYDCFIFAAVLHMDWSHNTITADDMTAFVARNVFESTFYRVTGIPQANIYTNRANLSVVQTSNTSRNFSVSIPFLFRNCPASFWPGVFLQSGYDTRIIQNMVQLSGQKSEDANAVTSLSITNYTYEPKDVLLARFLQQSPSLWPWYADFVLAA